MGLASGNEMGRWVVREARVDAQEHGEVTGEWGLCHHNVMCSLCGVQGRDLLTLFSWSETSVNSGA